MSRSPGDGPTFVATIDALCATLGPPATVLGDAGFASGEAVAEIEAREIEVLVAVSRPEAGRRYDFRPPPSADTKAPPEPKAAWRRKMQTDDAKAKYKKRKSTVEPVFGILKKVLGFTRFRFAVTSRPRGCSPPSPTTASASAP